MHITSPHNPRIKAAARLRDARERRQEQRFLIEGRREIQRAIAGGLRIVEAFVDEQQASAPQVEELSRQLEASGAAIYVASAGAFSRLCFGERNEAIVAVAKTPVRQLADLRLPTMPLVAVIEGVEKPGNVGAILRSADAAGVSAVIVADGGTDLFNPNAIRTSLGAIFTLPMVAASPHEVLNWLKAQKIAIFAARVGATIDYAAAAYRQPAAIVLGSEAKGLSGVWNDAAVTAISLPMLGVVDSLNVSASAAVLFYEALRQRRKG
jgi:TrmH family RNA methyltransferase